MVIAALCAGAAAATPAARADASSCASETIQAWPALTTSPAPAAPSAGSPCWTDVTPYPFGSDGNQVDPTSNSCVASPQPFGTGWNGDIQLATNGAVPCYLQVTSMAFRAWNRGLAAATYPAVQNGAAAVTNPFGVWLYNGTSWFPDPTFPGSSVCQGSTVLWAGKLDYWLIGRPYNSPPARPAPGTSEQTLCRFDGVNLVWEPLKLPAATLAKLSVAAAGSGGGPQGGVTAGACYAWNDCWFFGDDGIVVHWDGQTLSDASGGLATSPWLQGDFTGAVAGTDASGQQFGLAVARSTFYDAAGGGPIPLPAQPDGSPPPQLFGSQGGPFTPLAFTPPGTPQAGDPFTTDLVAVAADSQGDVWAAGDPSGAAGNKSQLAPLVRLTENGAAAPCAGYGASTFTTSPFQQWTALSVFPNDGSALAGALYSGASGKEPVLVRGVCGQPPAITRFQIPDPFNANQATAPPVPADLSGAVTAVVSNAGNDAWAATTIGQVLKPDGQSYAYTKPHLYRWTDGQPPAAPAGDDVESRPSLFTLDPPTYVPAPPTIVIVTPPIQTKTKRGKTKKVKEKAAIYSVKTKLPPARGGKLTLYVTFKVRRSVTIGVEALRGRKVVASSGLKHFGGHSGTLTLVLDPHRWPTGLKFVFPKATKKHG